ncbi:MAG: S8 family peptidase [Bacteroidales bacterium]|nr:S8 family peptidase [Bacteroidales bacterium]
MKKLCFTLLLVLCCGVMFGQGSYKIDKSLLQDLNQGDKSSRHPVIVMLNDTYDDVLLGQKTAFMTREQRRDFVVSDRKRYCETSQAEVLRLLNEACEKGQASDIHAFWVVNGISCEADAAMVNALAERSEVVSIFSDKLRPMLPEGEVARPLSTRSNAWHVDKVNAPAVWNYNGDSGYTGQGVVVAILDTGVNYNHLDIANSMWDGGEEFPHHGYDVSNHDDDPMDDHGHGSHCAGIVAGQGTAGIQTGVAPNAQVMAVKMMTGEGQGSDEMFFEAVEFALEHGADILSCSFGDVGTGGIAAHRQAFETVLQAGVIAAVAAGNDGQTQYAAPVPFNIESPGNCPPPWLHPDQRRLVEGGLTAVVSIGATTSTDGHSDFSSVGPATWTVGDQIGDYNDYPYENGNAAMPGLIRPDVSAPGSNITSLNYATNNDYIEYDGTSMATPCAAGVMALLLEADPELTPAGIDSIIELTAVKINNVTKNNIVGSGRIDALAAIDALTYHGPTNLTATFEDDEVNLQWEASESAVSYQVFRDGIRLADNLTELSYTDHIQYAGTYSYYVVGVFENGLNSLPSNYVVVDNPVVIETEVINDKRVELEWNLAEGVHEDFESGTFYQNMWVNDANSPWVISSTEGHDGSYCAKSTNTGMFTTSKLALAVNIPTTSLLRYWARISCFPLNGGGVFIDNVQYGETITDVKPWTQYSVPITPGNHLIEWKYANQLGEGDYANAFFIDDITVGNVFNVYRSTCDPTEPVLIGANVAEAEFVDYDWEDLPDGRYKYGISTDGGMNIAWSDCIDKDYTAVDETEDLGAIKRVTIITALGQVIYDAATDTDNSSKVLERYPAGVYVVNIVTDQRMVTKKVSVVR